MKIKKWINDKLHKAASFLDDNEKYNDDDLQLDDAYLDYECYFSEEEMLMHLKPEHESSGEVEEQTIRCVNEFSSEMDFEGYNKDYGHFEGHQMSFSNLVASSFRYAHFDDVSMVGSNISNADFYGAQMTHADFEYSEIRKTNFGLADLANADFQGCVIHNCDFSWSNLRGANFAEASIIDTSFEGAVYDENTRLPFSRSKASELGMVPSKDMHRAS